ncbi:TniQ protein [Motilibacter rhizosphaerae]|uniref:TniQ protein n=1 Tax=Motilibacter rhizosphaerae TaxID=598652 RepID=A0A4Q7NVB8_9ACTN|nr:TniQ family protein [Motilibacter rhizosphaerae]RZS91127.1 TniQ protein [Motilibacter rhizosphaerae]
MTHAAIAVRLAPLPGEALDSWVDAYAHDLHTPTGDLLRALGLSRLTAYRAHRTVLDDAETDALAATAGLDRDAVTALALNRWDGVALRIDPTTLLPDRKNLWTRGRGSRFCPACLDETGGRWKLSWQLAWAVACPEHRLLLADACPHCGKVPRYRDSRNWLVPEPGECGSPSTDGRNRGRAADACGFPLAGTPAPELPDASPVLHAQRVIDTWLAGGAHPVAGETVPTADAFTDLKTLAGFVLGSIEPADVPPDHPELLEAVTALAAARLPRTRTFTAPPTAALTAAALAVAAPALDAPSRGDAATGLELYVRRRRDQGKPITPSVLRNQIGASTPLLGDILVLAARPLRGSLERVRARDDAATVTTANVPQLFWHDATPHLLRSVCQPQLLALALSAAVLTSDGRNWQRAQLDLGVDEPRSVSYAWACIRDRGLLDFAERFVTSVRQTLSDAPPPIDYDRRRRRFPDVDPLTDDEWDNVVTTTGWDLPPAGSPRDAYTAMALHEILTGSDPIGRTGNPDYSKGFVNGYRTFTRARLPDAAPALHETAAARLAREGIHEPVTWTPTVAP